MTYNVDETIGVVTVSKCRALPSAQLYIFICMSNLGSRYLATDSGTDSMTLNFTMTTTTTTTTS